MVAGRLARPVATIANFAKKVKRGPSLFFRICAKCGIRMAKRRTETLDDLLRNEIRAGTLTTFAHKAGLAPWTLLRLRTGKGTRVHQGTALAIADALGIDPARVRAAIVASRDARG